MSEKDISEINIIYDINNQNNIRIFGSNFLKNNKNKCKMIINNKEYKITNEYKVKSNDNSKLQIKLKEIDNVTNMSYMFSGCSSLSSLPDISKWNTNNVRNMSYMLSGFSSFLKIFKVLSQEEKIKFPFEDIIKEVKAAHVHLFSGWV